MNWHSTSCNVGMSQERDLPYTSNTRQIVWVFHWVVQRQHFCDGERHFGPPFFVCILVVERDLFQTDDQDAPTFPQYPLDLGADLPEVV